MSSLQNDLKAINLQFLMLAREQARHNKLQAVWLFNLTDKEIDRISGLTLEEINDLAGCGRAIFTPPLIEGKRKCTPAIAAALMVTQSKGKEDVI